METVHERYSLETELFRERRIEVRELSVQLRVAKGELELKIAKVKGEEKVADGLTKHVDRNKKSRT